MVSTDQRARNFFVQVYVLPSQCTLKLITLTLRRTVSAPYVVEGQDNVWRSRAPGSDAHGNTMRQVVDGLRTEVCGQQKSQTTPATTNSNPICQLLPLVLDLDCGQSSCTNSCWLRQQVILKTMMFMLASPCPLSGSLLAMPLSI